VKDFFRSYDKPHLVVVRKSVFRLWIVERGGRVVDEAGIAIGRRKDLKPKVYAADDRTPEGLYKIIEAIHQDCPMDSPEYLRLRRMNAVRFLASEGYERWNRRGVDLGTNAYGYGFFRLNYPNQEDRRRYLKAIRAGEVPPKDEKAAEFVGMGNGIAIHGTNDPDSIGHPASTGCIRVRNEDLRRIAAYLEKGSYVLIGP
jgi:murein L,D-transpeptidase YafK